MNTPCKIVGIILVKDEDIYIERVVRNILHFCDEIFVDDGYSQDHTYPILTRLAAEYPNIKLYQSSDLRHSHTLIEHFAGTNTWVFGVDGDEIYDPVGLATMREQLRQGEFQDQWLIFGNVLHCTKIDPLKKIAKGYLAPPARSMTKLYNFSLIERWVNGYERLHCGELTFKPGYDAELRYRLDQQRSWDESYFRCLHSVFVKRSSLQKTFLFTTRWDPAEKVKKRQASQKGLLHSLWAALRWNGRLFFRKDWKHQQYRVGSVQTKDINSFFPESDSSCKNVH